MKYRVKINYTSFVFDDLEEASGFARTAKLHIDEGRGNNEVVIYIEDAEEEEE